MHNPSQGCQCIAPMRGRCRDSDVCLLSLDFARSLKLWVLHACFGDRSMPARQANIIATGNYNFFNLLTIALCVPLLDDACLPACAAAWLLPAATPSSLAPGARLAPAAAPKQDLHEHRPPEGPPAAACAAPGEPDAGGPGRPVEGAATLSGGPLPLPVWRRAARLLGLLAGLAPVVYASVRMVRRQRASQNTIWRFFTSLKLRVPSRETCGWMCMLS